jgi:hypothetical protein
VFSFLPDRTWEESTMANYNDCQLVTDAMGRHCIVAVSNRRPDGQAGSCYTLHAPDGQVVGGGSSLGTSGTGMGSDLAAMKNGRAAAERWLARQPLHAPGTANHRLRRKTDRGEQTQVAGSLVSPILSVPDQVAELYHSICPGLAKVTPSAQWPQARVWLLQNHWKACPDLGFWKALFERVQASDFLCGRMPPKNPGEKAWMANLDWILRTDKMHAILQGRYDNRGHH